MKMVNIRSLLACVVWACALLGGGRAEGLELKPGMGWLKPGGEWNLRTPIRVLLAGDSLMQSLGPQMRDSLRGYTNLTLIPFGRKSTGLSRSDYYNWPRALKERLVADKPHLVIFWVGTNDPQGIYGKSGLGEPCSNAWQLAYLGKIREIFHLVQQHRARLILMGPPVVSDPKLDAQLATINKLMGWVCRKDGVCYVDTRSILSDSRGRFLAEGSLLSGRRVSLRTPDGVHITTGGNQRIMEHLLPYVSLELKRCFYTQPASGTAAKPGARSGAQLSGKSAAR